MERPSQRSGTLLLTHVASCRLLTYLLIDLLTYVRAYKVTPSCPLRRYPRRRRRRVAQQARPSLTYLLLDHAYTYLRTYVRTN